MGWLAIQACASSLVQIGSAGPWNIGFALPFTPGMPARSAVVAPSPVTGFTSASWSAVRIARYYLNQRLWEQGEVWGMELEKVREFVEFTDSMNFTVAARTLHMS